MYELICASWNLILDKRCPDELCSFFASDNAGAPAGPKPAAHAAKDLSESGRTVSGRAAWPGWALSESESRAWTLEISFTIRALCSWK